MALSRPLCLDAESSVRHGEVSASAKAESIPDYGSKLTAQDIALEREKRSEAMLVIIIFPEPKETALTPLLRVCCRKL